MGEFDALSGYPQPAAPRKVSERAFKNRLIASQRGQEFFDGDRANGYGGLKDDGRWSVIADLMILKYNLSPVGSVLQLNAEKGFLVSKFLDRGIVAIGTEDSDYALENSVVPLKRMAPNFLMFGDKAFDLIVAIGPVYTRSLAGAIACLREIQRVGKQSFVTLGAYETEEDYKLLRAWSLLGTTLLRREEWIETLRFAGYTGDYKFVDARSLNLTWT